MSDDAVNYREGLSIVCPHCGRETIVKRQRKMDGWTVVGDVYACALCRAELADIADDSGAASETRAREDSRRLKALESLLNEDSASLQRPGLGDDEEARFCRDCVHFLKHPFISRCLLHERAVEPMDDCEDFSRRPEEDAGTDNGEESSS
jgi:hypothetical protein